MKAGRAGMDQPHLEGLPFSKDADLLLCNVLSVPLSDQDETQAQILASATVFKNVPRIYGMRVNEICCSFEEDRRRKTRRSLEGPPNELALLGLDETLKGGGEG